MQARRGLDGFDVSSRNAFSPTVSDRPFQTCTIDLRQAPRLNKECD
jgi:hypothetical protein